MSCAAPWQISKERAPIKTELAANLRIRGNLLALSLSKYCNVSAPVAAWIVCGSGLFPHPSCVNMETTSERSLLLRASEEMVIKNGRDGKSRRTAGS
jgi:hypothetical protein